MAISLDAVGIDQIEDIAMLQEQSVEKTIEKTDNRIKYDGTVADPAFELYDPKFKFDFDILGDLDAGLALATDGGFDHDLLTSGRTLITNVKTSESTDGDNSATVSGENCPAANAPAEE